MKNIVLLICLCSFIGTIKAQTYTPEEVAYAYGLSQTEGLRDYLSLRLNVDTTYMSSFVKGLPEGANNLNSEMTAYYAGVQIGIQIKDALIPGINKSLYGESSTKSISRNDFLKGFVDGALAEGMRMTKTQARTIVEVVENKSNKQAGVNVSLNDKQTSEKIKAQTHVTEEVSYAYGLLQTEGLRDYLTGRLDVDTTYMASFVKGLSEGANNLNSEMTAYYVGMQIGLQIKNSMISEVNKSLYGESSTKSISRNDFLKGFVDGALGEDMRITKAQARTIVEVAKNEVKYKSNKQAGVKFLANNKRTPGVVVLPSGLQYKIIKTGNGPIPRNDSKVKVHYIAALIDGTEFDNSYKRGEPMKVTVNQLIEGWAEALELMPVGSEWIIYIPQELAYGGRESGKIKPFSTLVYKVKLLGIISD